VQTVQVAVSTHNPGSSGSSGSGSSGSGSSGSGSSGAGSSSGGSSTGSSGSGSSPHESSTSGPESPTQPTDLDGTFELEPGADDAGAISGSWFEMLDPEDPPRPLKNINSPLANQDYTPLSPGTDGGLQTFAYQPAPSPAFSERTGGKEDGNALAAEIMQPQSFLGFNFSVVTQASDPQSKEADPLAQIIDDDGQLSGQLTAWAVGWNGEWFNQGAPKPNGTLPGGTIAPSGSYDAPSGHYVLEWKSLIVGGSFNGFLGSWHLEGTFVPAG
jgi:hypothetical protein